MEDHLPEERELTGTTLRDPFWHAVIEAHHAKIDACERALIAQTEQDKAGIGLAISRFIVDIHGGCLKASHNRDGGPTLFFTLRIGDKRP